MKLQVLLSVLDLKIEDLIKMNIKSDCVVINQCKENSFYEYKNFKIYSYCELGTSNSRNRGLELIDGDIILLCDDDVIYNNDYVDNVLHEFKKNEKADIIVFNIDSQNRNIKQNKKSKKLHFFNIQKYGSYRIAFKRKSIENANIKFNTLFGPNAKYSCGEDTLFLVDAMKKGLKIYSSKVNIGTVFQYSSTWFNGYNEKFFIDKGALFTAINKRFRVLLILQYLIRHMNIVKECKFLDAFKYMLKGSNCYICEQNNKNLK